VGAAGHVLELKLLVALTVDELLTHFFGGYELSLGAKSCDLFVGASALGLRGAKLLAMELVEGVEALAVQCGRGSANGAGGRFGWSSSREGHGTACDVDGQEQKTEGH
jgi:hypothetical protein